MKTPIQLNWIDIHVKLIFHFIFLLLFSRKQYFIYKIYIQFIILF